MEIGILQKQVNEWLNKGDIQESIIPYGVRTLLVLKKGGSWRMCVVSCAINKFIILYQFQFPRLKDMLDQLSSLVLFFTIDLKRGYIKSGLKRRMNRRLHLRPIRVCMSC